MSDIDPPLREYTRPPMTRGVDPQRMNWLWQLILQATDLNPADVRKALIAAGVGATDARLASWQVTDREDNYFPLSIAELERNLRSVVAWRRAKSAEAPADVPPVAVTGQADAAAPSVEADDAVGPGQE